MVVRVGASLIILGICRTANVTATQLLEYTGTEMCNFVIEGEIWSLNENERQQR